MGAVKQFYEECAEEGCCPVGEKTFAHLAEIETTAGVDWVEYCEKEYQGFDGKTYTQDCITLESARRLTLEGLATDEIADFVECFGW